MGGATSSHYLRTGIHFPTPTNGQERVQNCCKVYRARRQDSNPMTLVFERVEQGIADPRLAAVRPYVLGERNRPPLPNDMRVSLLPNAKYDARHGLIVEGAEALFVVFPTNHQHLNKIDDHVGQEVRVTQDLLRSLEVIPACRYCLEATPTHRFNTSVDNIHWCGHRALCGTCFEEYVVSTLEDMQQNPRARLKCLQCQHAYDPEIFLPYYTDGQLGVFHDPSMLDVQTSAWFPSVLEPKTHTPTALFDRFKDLLSLVRRNPAYDLHVPHRHCIVTEITGDRTRLVPVASAVMLSYSRRGRYLNDFGGQNNPILPDREYAIRDVKLLDTLWGYHRCPGGRAVGQPPDVTRPTMPTPRRVTPRSFAYPPSRTGWLTRTHVSPGFSRTTGRSTSVRITTPTACSVPAWTGSPTYEPSTDSWISPHRPPCSCRFCRRRVQPGFNPSTRRTSSGPSCCWSPGPLRGRLTETASKMSPMP